MKNEESCMKTRSFAFEMMKSAGGSVNSGTLIELELQVWTLGKTSHVRSSATSSCTLSADKTTSSCSRRYGSANVTSFVSPWTTIANRVSRNHEFCISNEELCVKKRGFCIKYDEFCRSLRRKLLSALA